MNLLLGRVPRSESPQATAILRTRRRAAVEVEATIGKGATIAVTYARDAPRPRVDAGSDSNGRYANENDVLRMLLAYTARCVETSVPERTVTLGSKVRGPGISNKARLGGESDVAGCAE